MSNKFWYVKAGTTYLAERQRYSRMEFTSTIAEAKRFSSKEKAQEIIDEKFGSNEDGFSPIRIYAS